MSRLVESIRLFNGEFSRLQLHEARMKNSLRRVFGKEAKWNLESLLTSSSIPREGLYKCRVLYDASHENVEFVPYAARQVRTLKIVYNNEIEYEHKWEAREQLNAAFAQRGSCDDILIVKNGLITDSYYANIAFHKAGKWYTPQSYLLPGTMRLSLLNAGVIEVCEITVDNFREFDHFKLINAMLEWDFPAIDVSNIY
jgi:4-amino-4-deoxychorismate lyase